MILINLYSSQLESGRGLPLLEFPSESISYLTPTWLTSVHQFLYQHNLTVTLTLALVPALRYRNDQYIMSNQALAPFTKSQCADIYLVRTHCLIWLLEWTGAPSVITSTKEHALLTSLQICLWLVNFRPLPLSADYGWNFWRLIIFDIVYFGRILWGTQFPIREHPWTILTRVNLQRVLTRSLCILELFLTSTGACCITSSKLKRTCWYGVHSNPDVDLKLSLMAV